MTGSSNPAAPDAPAKATLRAATRDERGINTVSMSTSEVVGALAGGTPHLPANGGIFKRNVALACQLSEEGRRLLCVVLARFAGAHRGGTNQIREQWDTGHTIAGRYLHPGEIAAFSKTQF